MNWILISELKHKMQTYQVNKKVVAQVTLFIIIFIVILDGYRKVVHSKRVSENAPKLPETLEKAIIYQDFEQDQTIVADDESAQCFIAPLEKSLPSPDEDLDSLVEKMQRGEYIPKLEKLHQKYKVHGEPIDNLNEHGPHAEQACEGKKAYKLSKIRGVVPGASCQYLKTSWNTGTMLVDAHLFHCH